MSELPKKVDIGPPFLRVAINGIIDYIKGIKPKAGIGTHVIQGPDGITINVIQEGRRVTDISWDSESGALVVEYDDGDRKQIEFVTCETGS